MKSIALEDTSLTAEQLASMAKDEAVILTRNGKPLVAVKNLKGADWETLSLVNNPRFVAIIEESRRAHRKQGGISIEQVREELGLKAKRRKRPQ